MLMGIDITDYQSVCFTKFYDAESDIIVTS